MGMRKATAAALSRQLAFELATQQNPDHAEQLLNAVRGVISRTSANRSSVMTACALIIASYERTTPTPGLLLEAFGHLVDMSSKADQVISQHQAGTA